MQHAEASCGLLSLAAHTSDAEGWLVPVVRASTAFCLKHALARVALAVVSLCLAAQPQRMQGA